MRIFGLQIEWKADFTAVAALLIATGSLVSQFYWAIRGADIDLFPSEQVFLNFDGLDRLRIVSTMTYINGGRTEYNDTILRESVFVVFPDYERVIVQRWQHFVEFDPLSKTSFLKIKQSAIPKLIGGRSSVSHETWFAPRSDDCPTAEICGKRNNRVTFEQFVDLIESRKSIDFLFSTKLASGETVFSSCSAIIDDAFRAQVKQSRWHSPPCRAIDGRKLIDRYNLSL